MFLTMASVGITVEVHHHEVATAGQCEIDMKFNTLVTMADSVLWYKYIVKNTARKHGKVATFMPKPKRIEFPPPAPSCNPYLAFSAMLMAGLDGIENKIDPGDPLDKNTYELSPEEAAKLKTVPGSLEESLRALEEDHDFLLKGGVFTKDVIDVWQEFKREVEIDPVRLRPHPWEFYLYFDA